MTDPDILALLKSIDSHLPAIQISLAATANAAREAEAEIPARVRRFMNYAHDVHAMQGMYREHGAEAPAHVKRESERCDDRFRQILAELHLDDGAFAKIRREMAADPANRWDHSRQLKGPSADETGNSQ